MHNSSAATSRDFLLWILHLMEDPDRSAELVALLENVDSAQKFGFTDGTHHCLEKEIMKSISDKCKSFAFIEESKTVPLQL